MNKKEWHKFYGHLRAFNRLGGGINMFGSDFNTALFFAVPDEMRRYVMWATGLKAKLFDLALSLYVPIRTRGG